MRKRPVPVMVRRRIKEEMAERLNVPLHMLVWKNRRLYKKVGGKMEPVWGSARKGHSAARRHSAKTRKRRSNYYDRHIDRFR